MISLTRRLAVDLVLEPWYTDPMKRTNQAQRSKNKTFFAVTSLGKNRWYWVVWPSLAMTQARQSGRPLAEGYEPTKADAVDQALEIAGLDGEWMAAKYAKDYYQQRSREKRAAAQGRVYAPEALPVALEFLYHDRQDEATKSWFSVPHRVVKKTKKYIYVEQQPYEATQRSGSWLEHDIATFRLSRMMLEREGYALTPVTEIDDPLFFTTPIQDRTAQFAYQTPACLRTLNLTFPCTDVEVKAAYRKLAKAAHPDQGGSEEKFRELQAAYEQALRLCRR